jgi:hypothetical protein
MSAWEFFSETRGKHGQKFLTWLCEQWQDEFKKYGSSLEAVLWLLDKPEQEAIDLMDEFCLEEINEF